MQQRATVYYQLIPIKKKSSKNIPDLIIEPLNCVKYNIKISSTVQSGYFRPIGDSLRVKGNDLEGPLFHQHLRY